MRVYDANGNLKTVAGAVNHNLLSITHPDTLAASVVRGDIIVGDSTPEWSRLAAGGAAAVLHGGTDPSYGPVITADITLNNVTNALLAQMASNTVKVNATGSPADPSDLAVGANEVVGRAGGNIVAGQVVTAQIAIGAVDNTKLADMAAWTLQLRNAGSSGDPAAVKISALTDEPSPAALDFVIIELASGEIRRADIGNLPGGGGGTDVQVDTGGSLSALDFQDGGDINFAESVNICTATIKASVVLNSMHANAPANTAKVNATASPAAPNDLTIGTNTVLGRVAGNIVAATIVTGQIANDAVSYAKMQNVVADDRLLGNVAGAGGVVAELTGTQATTVLAIFTDALKGLCPLSGGGTTNFLRADGTWTSPAGGGDVTGLSASLDNQIARFHLTDGKVIQGYTSLGPTVGDDGEIDMRSQVGMTGIISPATITADVDDYNPTGLATASHLRITMTGGSDWTISGIAGGVDGRLLLLSPISTSGLRLLLTNADAGSAAGNQILTGGATIRIEQDQSALLKYDGTTAKWRVVSVNGGRVRLNVVGGISDVDVNTVLGFGQGGTDQSTYAQGDIIYASATDVLAKLARGNVTGAIQILEQGATIPVWTTVPYEHTFILETPTSSENTGGFRVPFKVEVTGVIGVLKGAMTTCTIDIGHSTDMDETPAFDSVLTAPIAIVSKAGGTAGVLATDGSEDIPAGEWVWMKTTAGGGTGWISVTVTMRRIF